MYHWLIVAHSLRQKALALRRKAAEISLRASQGNLASPEEREEHDQLLHEVEESAKQYNQVKSQMDERPSGLKLSMTSRAHLANASAGSAEHSPEASRPASPGQQLGEYKVVSI